MHEDDDGELGHLRSFAERWATGTLRQADRVVGARKRALRQDRTYERMEDWSPTLAEVQQAFDDAWVEQHLFVVAAHQFFNWANRLADSHAAVRRHHLDSALRTLRNSLEHLDEAVLEGDVASPDARLPSKNWFLASLPGGVLSLGSDWRGPTMKAFGVVDVDPILTECQAVMSEIFEEHAIAAATGAPAPIVVPGSGHFLDTDLTTALRIALTDLGVTKG